MWPIWISVAPPHVPKTHTGRVCGRAAPTPKSRRAPTFTWYSTACGSCTGPAGMRPAATTTRGVASGCPPCCCCCCCEVCLPGHRGRQPATTTGRATKVEFRTWGMEVAVGRIDRSSLAVRIYGHSKGPHHPGAQRMGQLPANESWRHGRCARPTAAPKQSTATHTIT